MAKQKKHAEAVNHERWLISYADFITLLFAFFVVLYASSQVDQHKASNLAKAIEHAFQDLGMFQVSSPQPPLTQTYGATTQPQSPQVVNSSHVAAGVNKLADELAAAFAPEIKARRIAVRATPEGTVISLRELGFFPSGSANLIPDSTHLLLRITANIKTKYFPVRVEGHTDDVPIHNDRFASNWELSSTRAVAVVEQIAAYGLAPERLSAAGYAQFRPLVPNTSWKARALNRRVDIVVLNGLTPIAEYSDATAPNILPSPPKVITPR